MRPSEGLRRPPEGNTLLRDRLGLLRAFCRFLWRPRRGLHLSHRPGELRVHLGHAPATMRRISASSSAPPSARGRCRGIQKDWCKACYVTFGSSWSLRFPSSPAVRSTRKGHAVRVNNRCMGGSRGKIRPSECGHVAPVVIREVEHGYVAQCLVCGTDGPTREDSQEALKVLQDLAWDG